MANIGTVEGVLKLKDLFTPELEKMTSVGARLSTGLTAPLLAAAGAATKFSVDFNESMANVATLIPGNIDRVRGLKKEVQNLSIETGKSTGDLSEGLYQVVSAFGDAADSAEKLRINAQAAVGGVASTLESIDLTSAITKAYGDTTAEAVEHVADLALETVRLGQTTFPQLAASMGRVAPIAQSMGQSQEELFAVFATGTGVVGTASEVATQYRGVLAGLLKPTESLTDLVSRLGFDSGEAALDGLGLVGVLQAIGEEAERTGKPITEFISQIEAAPLALALAGPQADAFRDKLGQLEQASGAVGVAFREQAEGINDAGFKMKQALARLQVSFQQLGDAVAPVMANFLSPMAKVLETVASAFSNLPPPMQTVIIALAGIAAAAGPVLVVAGQLTIAWSAFALAFPAQAAKVILAAKGMWAAFTGPVGWVAAGVALLAAWKPARDLMVSIGSTVISALVSWFKKAASVVADFWKRTEYLRAVLWELAKIIGRGLVAYLSNLVNGFKIVIKWVGDFARGVKILIQDSKLAQIVFDTLKGGLETLGKAVKFAVEWWAKLIGKLDIVKKAKFNVEFNKGVNAMEDALTGAGPVAQEFSQQMDELKARIDAVVPPGKKLKKTAEDMADGLASLSKSVESLKKQLSLMEDFGVSAEVAAKAAEILLDKKNKRTAEEVLRLAQEMENLEDKIQDLTDSREKLLEVEKEQLRISGELYEQARDAARDLEEMVAEMEREAQIAAELAAIRAELFLNDEAYAEVLRRYNTEQEIANALKQARNLMEVQYAAVMADVTIGEAERLRKLGELAAGYEEYARRVRAAAEAEDEAERGQEGADRAAEKWREEQERLLELALRQADAWSEAGRVIAGVFDDLGSDLGDLIVGLGDAAAAWKEYAAYERAYNAARAEGNQAGMDAAAAGMANAQGMGYASLWAAAGQFIGSAAAGGGTSGFGGELGGTYSEEGYQVGSLFGPVWGAVGAVFGAMIEKSGDKARVALEDFGDTISAGVVYAEGGLGDAANAIAGEINNFIATIEAQFGIALEESGDLAFQFKDTGVLEVTIAGAVKGFRDLGEAMGWAAEQLLKLNRDVPGLGENMQALLAGLGGQGVADSLEELQAALGLAMEADRGAMGEQLAAMQQITAQRKQDMELAEKYGFAYADIIAVTDRRIAQLREEVEGMRASLFGTTDFASQAAEIVNAMKAFNKGIDAETQSRKRALASIQGMTAGLSESAAEAEKELSRLRAGGTADVFQQAVEGFNSLGRGTSRLRDAMGGASGAMSGAAGEATGMVEAFTDVKKARFEERRELFESVSALERNQEEIEALRDSLDKIPEAFSAQEIADVWTKSASDAGLALIGLIRQVRGEEFGAAQERQLMADIFRLQLAVQLQAVYQLLEAAETLRASTRAILTDLAAQAENILAGPINLRPRGGGGRDTGAAQRRQQREEFRADLARLEAQMSGAIPALLDYQDALQEINDRAEEMGRIGVSAAETARFIELAGQALRDEFLAPFRAIIDAANQDPFGALLDRYREAVALDQEMRSDEGGGDMFQGDGGAPQFMASFMAGVSEEIAGAFGIELMGDLEDALANASSQSEIQEIMDDFLDLDVPDELLFVFQDLFPEAFAAAGEAMDRVIQEVEDSLQGFLDDAAGIGQFQRRLMDLQQTFADARDRLGVDPPAQKDALKPITDSIQDLSEAGDDAGKVIEDIVDSMGRASDAMADAADMRDDLTDAEQRGIDRIAFDFIGTLDQLGVSLPVDQTIALAQAQFELARIEAINTALALQASGALQDVAFDWDALILALQGAEFDPSSLGLGGPLGGGGLDIDTSQPFDSYEDLLEQIQDGIDAWLNLDVGPATQGARQLLSDLDDMHDLLAQTLETGSGAAIADYAENLAAINAAFEVAVGAFVDDVLGPFEDAGLSDLEREYADLQEQFWDIAQAFEELNLGAEEMERLAAAQQAALEAFWDRATAGIQDIIERLTGVESGRAPVDLLAEQQETVQDLFDRVMSGDLSALEDLDAESEDLLDLIDQIYGSGRAGGILRDQLLAMLQQVAGLDPGDILDPGTDPGPDGGPLGGILDAPYELKGSDIIAEPFDVAAYLSGSYDPGSSTKSVFEDVMEKNRTEMQRYDRDRERERRLWEMQNIDAEMRQRSILIRTTEEAGKAPVNEGVRVGV